MTHLEQTPIAESVTALFRESPFAQPGEYHELQVAAGQSIAEIISHIAQPWQHDYLRVVLNGEVIDQDQWPLTVPGAKDTLNIILVPRGGDAGGILKAIAIIAIVVVVSYFTAGALGPAAAGGMGLMSASAAAAVGAGVGAIAGLVAGLALNAVFPPPAPSAMQPGSSGVSEDPVYGFSKVSNASNPYGCIPRVYGRRKIMPQHAMNPVIISSGTNQYLYQAFTAGYGPLQIEDIRIGDTPIGNYSEVDIHIHESFAAGDTLHLINQDVWQDPFSIKLTNNTVNVIETTDDAQAFAIDFQFGQGLFWVDSGNGNFNAETVSFQLQIRPKGSDFWSNLGTFEHSIDGGSLSGDTITVSRKSQRPFFVTAHVTLPAAGKYEIRAVRTTEDREGRESNKSYDTVYIASLRSIRFVAPIAPDKPISLIEVKIRATEQLNGAINNLSCIVTSKLPVYNGTTWSVQATRNPAWCYLDAMRGSAVRRPVKDHRIPFGDMLEWAIWCDTAMANAPGMARAMCDLEITSATSVYETMKLIAATGFATPSMAGNKYTVAIDRLRATPVQMFTPRNSKLVNGSIGYHIQPHALRMQFTPTDETTADEVVVFDDGYSADGSNGTQVATRYEVMKLVGVSRREQAYVIGRRSLAQGRLRIEQWTINADVEYLIATRGSYVCFAHNVPMIGSGHGRVIGKAGQVITLDEPISATGTIYARIRRSDNTQQEYGVSSYTGSTITLSGDPSAINDGDLVVYGNLNQVVEECFVKSVNPAGGHTAELVLVPYAPGVYTAEVAAIPPYQPVISWSGGTANGGTAGLGGKSTTPKEVNSLQAGVIISYVENAPRLSVNLSWTPPVNSAAVYGYMVYHYTGGRWVLRATVYETSAVAYSDYQFVDEAGQPVNMNGVGMVFAVSAIGADGSSLPPELAAHTSVTPQILGPASVAGASVVGGVFENKLAWQLATNGFDVAYAEIWASADNDRSHATLIATVKAPTSSYNHVGLEPGITWYYWIRLKDAASNTSTWYPGGTTSGIGSAPTTDAAYLLEQLQGAVGLAQVAEEIARPVSLIDLLKFKVDWELGNANIQKLAEKTFDDNERVHSTAQVITEAAARATGDEASAILIQEVSARLDTGDYAVVKEQSEATASLIEGVNAKYLLQVDANGHVAAVQLGSNGTESSMVWLADKFLIAKPDGTGIKQLLTIGEVNGVNVLGFDGYLLGAGGTFSGNLQAASGTFMGELVAATGTFSGSLSAGTVDISKLVGYTEARSGAGSYQFTVQNDQTNIRYQLLAGGGGGGVGDYGEWNTRAGGGGGGGAGQYLIGTAGPFAAGTIIRLVNGHAGAAGLEWQQNGGDGGATYLQYSNDNGNNFTTFVYADYGRGGRCAPDAYYDNADGDWAGGDGGFGYPSGENPGGGDNWSGSPNTDRGGNGASSIWGTGGSGVHNGGGNPATGYGAGGAGGGFHWGWRNNDWHNSGKYNGWYPGASGSPGRGILEFFNPNAVVLKTQYNELETRVISLEQRVTALGG
jgi:predicted phage tail protein